MKKIILMLLGSAFAFPIMAQTYTARVSKDSVNTLANRIELLKANIKLLEVKIDEAKEEAEVEKLRQKLLEANGNARVSAEQMSNQSNKTSSLSAVDLKAIDKLSKKSKSDTNEAQKALERFNKQIAKVEDIRTQIQGEERKVGYKVPKLIYDYKQNF
ncbi:hypothetical protein [Pedobacter aquatilis]|uniref:hypothetical protein n=1 Tax=Pedobacter aquatilis TaxID=351343 RepID=UPI00292F1EC6|nr:hypothetical protein [Pedobacter aquatilis]